MKYWKPMKNLGMKIKLLKISNVNYDYNTQNQKTKIRKYVSTVNTENTLVQLKMIK